MINIVAIALLISSLTAAGIFSPVPNSGDPPPLREGHRLIVLEYEREIPSNPPLEKLPNLGQGISTPEIHSHSAKELVCDAYGTCKEAAKTAVEKASELEENAKESVDKITEGAKRTIEKASEIEENVKDAAEKGARDAAEKIGGALRKGKEKIEKEAKIATETAKDAVECAARDVGRNLSRFSAELMGRMRKSVADFDAAGTGRLVAWVVHVVGFAVAYGTSTWVTFVSSHVLAAGLPRQQFGVVQSKVYPVYFRVVACGVAAAWGGHWFGRGTGPASAGRWERVERVEGYNLVVALGLVLVNMCYFEPRATKVRN